MHCGCETSPGPEFDVMSGRIAGGPKNAELCCPKDDLDERELIHSLNTSVSLDRRIRDLSVQRRFRFTRSTRRRNCAQKQCGTKGREDPVAQRDQNTDRDAHSEGETAEQYGAAPSNDPGMESHQQP